MGSALLQMETARPGNLFPTAAALLRWGGSGNGAAFKRQGMPVTIDRYMAPLRAILRKCENEWGV